MMSTKTEISFERKFKKFLHKNGFVQSHSHFDVLKEIKKTPESVIDVGVNTGTPWLYDLFTEADFLLIDPQKKLEKTITNFPKKYKIINKALGSENKKILLKEKINKAKSTILNSTELIAAKVTSEYEVEMTTLDDVIDKEKVTGDIGLKIDTEGYEVEVIKGLEKYKNQVSFVIAEASVLDRFHGSYNFSELISVFYDKGFRFYNIMNLAKCKAPRFYDCLFLRKDDPLFKGLS